MQVYQRLKELRLEKELSQKAVAEALGMVYQQYARYENGTNEIPFRHVITLAKFYGVSLDYLAGLSDQR